MLVYRIVHKSFSNSLIASGMEGRWNSGGKKVIYAAESIALAFLENMIRRQGVGFNQDFKIMIIDIPERVKIAAVDVAALENGWRNFQDYSKCQPWGDEWYNKREALVLKVPSAVLPEAFNYIINTSHVDYSKIKLIQTSDLIPDQRIEDILKKYAKP